MIGRDIAGVRSHNPRKKRGLSSLSPLSSSLIFVLRSDARPLSALPLSTASLSPSSVVSLYRTFAAVALCCSSFPFLLTLGTLFISSSSSFVPYVEAHTRIYTEEVTLFSSLSVEVHGPRSCPDSGRSIGFLPHLRDSPPSLSRAPFRRLPLLLLLLRNRRLLLLLLLSFPSRSASPVRRRLLGHRMSYKYVHGQSVVFK